MRELPHGNPFLFYAKNVVRKCLLKTSIISEYYYIIQDDLALVANPAKEDAKH